VKNRFLGEDIHHEFKGHRNLTMEQIPIHARTNRSQRPISRNLCGFLNTGLGGVVYIGITDSGEVFGVPLTPYQRDHFSLNVQDTLGRFTPPVTEDMYLLRYIPVVDEVDQKREINSPSRVDLQRKTSHRLRTSTYCWCDTDAKAQFDTGKIAQNFVIEIEILPWNPDLKLALTKKTRIQPLFSNEENLYFIRRISGLYQPTVSEVISLSEAETLRYHSRKQTSSK